jgi:hypothetical protein
MMRPWILRWTSALLVAVGVIGCSSSDERFVELAQQSVARQAEQNHEIAQQSQKVAETTHELVQADARARAELIEAQRSLEESLQAARSKLDNERDKLELDRQALATAKEREPIVASAIWSAALLVAVVLPLVLCIYLIRTVGTDAPSHDLAELLVYELTSEQSLLLPMPQAKSPRQELAPPQPCLPDGESQA